MQNNALQLTPGHTVISLWKMLRFNLKLQTKRVIMKFGLPHGGISTICRNLFWICWINWIGKNFKWFLIYTDVYNGQHIMGYDILSKFFIIRSRVSHSGGHGGHPPPILSYFFWTLPTKLMPPMEYPHLKMRKWNIQNFVKKVQQKIVEDIWLTDLVNQLHDIEKFLDLILWHVLLKIVLFYWEIL